MSQTKSFIAVVSVKTVAAGYNVGRVTSNVKWRKCNVVISFQSEAIKFAKLAHFEFVARYKTGGWAPFELVSAPPNMFRERHKLDR